MKIKILSIVALAFLAASCKKETVDTTGLEAGKSLNEINVPSEFDWKTTQDVKFSVGISDSRFGNEIHTIEIYAGNPANGGQLVSKGAATLISPYNVKVSLPKVLTEAYIVKTAQDGSKVSGSIAILTNNVSVSVSAGAVIGSVSGISSANKGKAASTLAVLTRKTPPSVPSSALTLTQNANIAANTAYVVSSNVNVTYNNINVNNAGASIYIAPGAGIVTLGLNINRSINIYVLPGAKLSLSGSNYNGAFKIENFGEVSNLGNFKLTSGSSFYNDAQTLTINGFEIQSGADLTNFGNLTIQGQVNYNGTINNGGTITHNGQLNSNNNSSVFVNTKKYVFNSAPNIAGMFDNSGELIITSAGDANFNGSQASFNTGTIVANNAKLNVSGIITNHGSIVAKHLNFTGSSKLTNHCKIIAHDNAILDAAVFNYNYIYVGKNTDVNSPGILTQYSYDGGQKAMFSTNTFGNFSPNQNFSGAGTAYSLVKIRQSVGSQINNGGQPIFVNKTYVLKPESQTISTSKFFGGATFIGVDDSSYYIAKDQCNDEGYGSSNPNLSKPDTDGDGVIDEEDDFPTDPTKAFIHYSVNYHKGGSSIAFEDNWPNKGDYDLNDIVITYRYKVISNAANKVVRLEADYKLLATGGSFNNGAGIQFNIPAGKAKGFVGTQGTYLEDGQDSVVVILFKDGRKEQLTWNTDLQQAVSPVKEYSISFDVENGPNMDTFGIGSYNPFIWNNSQGYGRGYETHLLGKFPTNKANVDLFGTADDNSLASYKYSTKDNLPYALEIPTAPFRYPLERVAITDVYLKFAQWASSGGQQYPDWYTNTSAGYVNNSLIYTR